MTLKEALAYTWLLLRGRAPSQVPGPVTRHRPTFPRGLCPTCGRDVAQTRRGSYRHRCRPDVTQADTMRGSTAERGVLGHVPLGPSADGEAS